MKKHFAIIGDEVQRKSGRPVNLTLRNGKWPTGTWFQARLGQVLMCKAVRLQYKGERHEAGTL